ncbi:hypothetical protein [Salipiger sp. PrR007]|uniref:hypothetical protein n=1 Tax=Salipiger sp. PrR007 TaxID=2706884 RepID=UPI0013B88E08|nr:hypothetical protein [Salipiger sp. PrR007]NDW33101.1 hypothetical protein [Salipiger sp. PrR007]
MSTPTGAEPFQDILDGYFTLKESVRQMMERHDLGWVWLALWHAPVMDIAGLGPKEPVPLHLRDGYAGVIEGLSLTAVRTGADAEPVLIGTGDWRWLDTRADQALPQDIRLAEPAFFRGIGLSLGGAANRRSIPATELTEDFARIAEQPGGSAFTA